MKLNDKQYIETYDKLGSDYFNKGNDKQLREWGNSDEQIEKLKISCVKQHIRFYKIGIKTYKTLNKLCGGINII